MNKKIFFSLALLLLQISLSAMDIGLTEEEFYSYNATRAKKILVDNFNTGRIGLCDFNINFYILHLKNPKNDPFPKKIEIIFTSRFSNLEKLNDFLLLFQKRSIRVIPIFFRTQNKDNILQIITNLNR